MATNVLKKIEKHIETIEPGKPQTVGAMAPNSDCMWQGDVGVVYVGPDVPKDWKLRPVTDREVQVAVGTGIGSRHCVSLTEVEVYDKPGTALDGPGIVAKAAGWTLRHPEHGDVTFTDPGCFAIVYQRMLADELRATMD